eukprot:CAMPEP_0113449536 /NCGR_PEP_ID=MMETSP0014_2-20120614/5351_1 /TAXON_ID=2857 /ORGANISM="Nitzschia sp." /LENGTH=1855 /DNA_ID=CAMNT_0000340819 /DNA_START=9 /DNA_END=5576 /DNA_ORIENTATION=- /assembly_acc=CAM_ASM_000159
MPLPRVEVLKSTCLRPSFSLRRQLTTAYGITAFLTIFLVVLCATIAAIRAGDAVTNQTETLFREQLFGGMTERNFLTVEILTKKFSNLKSTSSLLTEIVRDRIVGYPDDGWEDDNHVPFIDRETRQRVYPLKANLLPRDWQVKSNWNETNLEEHAQERADIFRGLVGFLLTESAFFFFQGNCNPNHTLPSQLAYYPVCTDEYNDAALGGKVNPTDTLAPLEQKAADIGVFMKPIWEAEPLAMAVNVYFFNSGAGASLIFPSYQADSSAYYQSAGCEWMDQINTLTGRPYGTAARRFCRPAGDLVSIRNYNPMERPFCADQALHPGQTRIFGPYLDTPFRQWRMSIGEAVFDRRTGEFIACTSIDLSLELSNALFDSVRLTDRTELAVTRPDGSVVSASTSDVDFSKEEETFHLIDTAFIDEQTYNELLEEHRFWDGVWDGSDDINFRKASVRISNGRYYTVTVSPPPPTSYDPKYYPDFLVWSSYNIEELQGVVQEISDEVDGDVRGLILVSVLLGSVGLVVLLVFVWVVAQQLTNPLDYMDRASWQIVNHAGQNKLTVDPDESSQGLDEKPFLLCTPRTEVRELVGEFQKMIRGFSGEGASRVALPQMNEIKNCVTWKEEFSQTYKLDSIETQIQAEMSTAAQSVGRRLSRRASNSLPLDAEIVSDDENEFRSIEMNTRATDTVQTSGEASSQTVKVESTGVQSAPPTIPFQSEVAAFFSSTKQNVRVNRERNLQHVPNSDEKTIDRSVRVSRSSLYWTILCWICLPILLSIIAISTVVAVRLRASFPTWISSAKSSSYLLQLDIFLSEGSLRALFAEQALPGPARDLYLLTRLAGWLLFGAVGRSDAFTDIEMEFVEACKRYDADEACPSFDNDIFRSPCDCAWEDPWAGNMRCQNVPADSRAIQRWWYMNQARDFDPETGNRLQSKSFPEWDYSAESTSWWTDPDLLPGTSKGVNATGYTTAYDRLRVISALSTAAFPIYNYVSNTYTNDRHTAFSTYVAFEGDGTFTGYAGCNYDFKTYANFVSSEENRAYVINEDLCPLGKYGYDPRCRQWYKDAKDDALNGVQGVHITLPYQFANTDDIGSSAVSALVDQTTGEFVGTTIIDFSLSEVYDILEIDMGDLFAVIATNALEIDTVASSAQGRGEPAVSSFSVLAPFDVPDDENKGRLSSIISRAKSGKKIEEERFTRNTANGETEEFLVTSFPIILRELTPVAPDDFTRGARAIDTTLYALVVGISRDNLNFSFKTIDGVIVDELRTISIAYLCIAGIITLGCLCMTARISVAVTKPMLQILQAVRQVNTGRFEDNIPPLSDGSRDVARVYSAFAKLYAVVRMSNNSYWSGDLALAHHIADDALELFRKIADRKAVGIGCNNMANCIFAQMANTRRFGRCNAAVAECCVKGCCMKSALQLYDEAIECSTNYFENDEITDAERSLFAQQLADRHFNRGLLLLLSLDDPCSPEDAKDRGLTDIFKSRSFDQGTREYMLHTATMYRNADIIFERIVRRLIGLALVIEYDGTDVCQAWDPYELVDEADLMLQAAWRDDNCILFRSISRIGRLQQLEGAVVTLELCSGNSCDAFLLSSRIIVEDEYVIESAFREVLTCLLLMTRENSFSPASTSSLQRELEQMKSSCRLKSLGIGSRSYVFCFELTSDGTDLRSGLIRNHFLDLYDSIVYPEDQVTVVMTSPGDGDILSISCKGFEKDGRNSIERAMSSRNNGDLSQCVLARAMDLVEDIGGSCSGAAPSDIVLLYITDGSVLEQDAYRSLIRKVQQNESSNNQKTPSIDFITIGFDLQDEVDNFCSSLSHTARCTYLAASGFDEESVAQAIGNAADISCRLNQRRIQSALTMEKF